ncbi:hypothetical protein MNBD_UNCLBAC01-1074 [hydrothermal vent metagenome]|uniref:Lipoprotein n=1 Tax=hydrothermal vent metagenome TaxID=652676 RepID=A0A3B1DPD5_9ZZZZ
MRKLFLFIGFILLTSGCTLYRIDSQDMTTKYYPPKKSLEGIIYVERTEKSHEVIGIVTVNAERRQRVSHVIEKMKREAAILGGDAITNIKTDATGVWKRLPAQEFVGNGYVRANFTADVIVFK